MKTELKPSAAGSRPELLVTGLAPNSIAWLTAVAPRLANRLGVLAAADGSAWFVVPHPGHWRLVHERGEKNVEVRAWKEVSAPG